MSEVPPLESPDATKKSRSLNAARACLYAPIIVFILGFAVQLTKPDSSPRAWLPGVNFIITAIGLICGIIALFGIKKHGRERILWRAVVGLIVNAMLLIALTLIMLRLHSFSM